MQKRTREMVQFLWYYCLYTVCAHSLHDSSCRASLRPRVVLSESVRRGVTDAKENVPNRSVLVVLFPIYSVCPLSA
jgi:hypothetical protein